MYWWVIRLTVWCLFIALCRSDQYTNPLLTGEVKECKDGKFYDLTASYTEKAIVSPNFPGYYPKNVRCGFRIKSSNNNHRIHLDIEHAAVGNPSKCGLDALNIYDGPSEKSVLIGKVCYNVARYISTNEYMFLEFSSYSNDQTRGPGFRAKYYTLEVPECKSEEYDYKGVIICLLLTAILVVFVIFCTLYKMDKLGQVRRCCFNCVRCKKSGPPSWQPPPIQIVEEAPPARNSTLTVNINHLDPPPYFPNDSSSELPPSYEEVMRNISISTVQQNSVK